MDKVQLLSPSVASQIAAGEVVSRPASVVKELVENSVDAGATQISVALTEAGRNMIQVTDNGCGMSQADAMLSFQRHATSKIRETDDLYSLSTFGFRGEAIPSIAAVSEVKLRTRTSDSDTGVQVSCAGTDQLECEPCVCPTGTVFTVRNLFFNVPARRKFLKSNQTELTHIMTEIERVSLAHPEVAFDLSHQGQTLLSLPASALKTRIVNLFGHRMDKALLPVHVETSVVKINGFVSNLESTRGRGAQQFFFVNGRFIKHPYFHKAVLQAYENLVQSNDQPSYFIFLEVAPDQIDVNIHPTKTEVKFQDEVVIWKILMAAVREAVGKFEQMPTIDFNVADMPEIPAFDPNAASRQPSVSYNPSYNPFNTVSGHGGSASYGGGNNTQKRLSDEWTRLYDQPASSHQVKEESLSYGQAESEIRLLGQFCDRFIVVPADGGLKFVDQHRAHVRILYEDFLQRTQNHTATSQGLLFPEMFQLSPSMAQTFDSLADRFASLGFDLSNMGHGAVAVQGVPSGLEGRDYQSMITEMIQDWMESPQMEQERQLHILALAMARNSATPSGRHLSADEMKHLLAGLDACSMPSKTPDGHDVWWILSNSELERHFQ